jgi:hypothetical protein
MMSKEKLTPSSLTRFALKWTAIAVWFDFSDRLIGSSFDWLFTLSHWTVWLDGFTNVVCK